jgi:chromosome segregation ATPase
MEDDFLYSASINQISHNNNNNNNVVQSIYYDAPNNNDLISQIDQLKDQLDAKTKQTNELSECLLKQTNFCESLSDLLKKNEEKNKELETNLIRNVAKLVELDENNTNLKKELEMLKQNQLDTQSNLTNESDLFKETLSQKETLNNMREMCAEQEKIIRQLKTELNIIKQERENEIESQNSLIQRHQITLQLKEEEIYLLNDQIQKITRSLDEEMKDNAQTKIEIEELKNYYKELNEKNSALMTQLEADNSEIKKRLVKLIKY